MLVLLLLLQLRVPDAAQFVGPPRGTPIAGEALQRETQRVGALLRCPVCQGMSIADSPAEMAVNMKSQVHELLARGYTEEQILDYFEKSYGQFVLLRPKSKILWVLPLVALLLGVVVVAMKIRSLEKPQTTSNPQPATDDPYLARVRDLVGGGKE
jgi:cytochrome c-type biogenesis protein CcmH